MALIDRIVYLKGLMEKTRIPIWYPRDVEGEGQNANQVRLYEVADSVSDLSGVILELNDDLSKIIDITTYSSDDNQVRRSVHEVAHHAKGRICGGD